MSRFSNALSGISGFIDDIKKIAVFAFILCSGIVSGFIWLSNKQSERTMVNVETIVSKHTNSIKSDIHRVEQKADANSERIDKIEKKDTVDNAEFIIKQAKKINEDVNDVKESDIRTAIRYFNNLNMSHLNSEMQVDAKLAYEEILDYYQRIKYKNGK